MQLCQLPRALLTLKISYAANRHATQASHTGQRQNYIAAAIGAGINTRTGAHDEAEELADDTAR